MSDFEEPKTKKKSVVPFVIISVIVVIILLFIIGKAKIDKLLYQENYNQIVYDMLDSATLAEDLGNQIISVWNNAIWEIDDTKTNKYTKKDGKFVSDFNEALDNLFMDESFSSDYLELINTQELVKANMKEMVDYPRGFENAYRILENFYHLYCKFTDIVIDCNGSLQTFSDSFSKADEEFAQLINTIDLYIK